MMPLWTTATRSVACGWALCSVGAPWVAQRVWPMPILPPSGSKASFCARLPSLPSARRRIDAAVFERGDPGAVVAAVFEPLERIHEPGATGSVPMMPTMPHMPCYSLDFDRLIASALARSLGA